MKIARLQLPTLSSFALIAAAGLFGWLWWRSYSNADSLLLFVPSDRMQSVTSVQGCTQWMISNVSVGPQWSWSVDISIDKASHVFSGTAGTAIPTRIDASLLPAQLISINPFVPNWNRLGFGFCTLDGQDVRVPGARAAIFTVPHWLLIMLCLIVPLQRGVLYRRRRRWVKERRCLACGYDLRASPGRCPECGAETLGL